MDKRTALEKLGKNSISELSPKDFAAILELLPQMSDVEAKEFFDHIASSSQGLEAISKHFHKTIRSDIAQKAKVTEAVNSADRAIIDGLIKQAERDDSTTEERREIRNDLFKLSQRMHETDDKERDFSEKREKMLEEHDKTIIGFCIGFGLWVLYNLLENNKKNKNS